MWRVTIHADGAPYRTLLLSELDGALGRVVEEASRTHHFVTVHARRSVPQGR